MHRYLLVGGCLIIVSCSQKSVNNSGQVSKAAEVVSVPEAKIDVKRNAEATAELLRYLKQFERPVQQYVIAADSNRVVTGTHGTRIYIVPSDLEAVDGSAVGSPIAVNLIELQSQQDFIRNRTATTSNGRFLESGGSYYISCSAAGKQLKLKTGRKLAVQFPRQSAKPMQLFYGARTLEGTINWTPDREVLRPKTKPDSFTVSVPVPKYKDTILAEMEVRPDHKPVTIDLDKFRQYGKIGIKIMDGRVCYVGRTPDLNNPEFVQKKVAAASNESGDVYEVAQLFKMGWINCDRFYNSEMTTLAVAIPAGILKQDIEAYVVFNGINGLIQQRLYYSPTGQYTISSLPLNKQATVLAFFWKDGTAYGAASSVAIQKDAKVTLDLKPVSKAEIVKLMSM